MNFSKYYMNSVIVSVCIFLFLIMCNTMIYSLKRSVSEQNTIAKANNEEENPFVTILSKSF